MKMYIYGWGHDCYNFPEFSSFSAFIALVHPDTYVNASLGETVVQYCVAMTDVQDVTIDWYDPDGAVMETVLNK